jgi:hypothetical protein
VVRVIQVFQEIGKLPGAEEAIEYTQSLTMASVRKDYDAAIQQGITSLIHLMVETGNAEDANRVFSVFGELTSELYRTGKLRLLSFLLKEVSYHADTITRTGNQAVIIRCLELLERIGMVAAQQGIDDLIHHCALAFHRIGTGSLERGCITEESVLRPLLKIEQAIPLDYRQIKSEVSYVIKEIQKAVGVGDEKPVLDTSDLWAKHED